MKNLLITGLCVGMLTAGAQAQDPGIADTVKLIGDSLIIGQSRSVDLVIVNDEELGLIEIPLLMESLDGGWMTYDSAVFVGRMSDPSVLNFRVFSSRENDGVSPDSIEIAGMAMGDNLLPPGNDAVARLYFTGTSLGTASLDTCTLLPYNYLLLIAGGNAAIMPAFTGVTLDVVDAALPPRITLPETPFRVVAGATVGFDVFAESPAGQDVAIELVELTGYDSPATPSIAPTLGTGSPASFEWLTTAADVGIWKAVIRVCDEDGLCVSGVVEIQVVTSSAYLIAFDEKGSTVANDSWGMTFGNFDSDANAELVSAGGPVEETGGRELYDYDAAAQTFTCIYSESGGNFNQGPCPVYFDADDNLDLVISQGIEGNDVIYFLAGDGNNGFDLVTQSASDYVFRGAVLCEVTRDQYLDYIVAAKDRVYIYSSDAEYSFDLMRYITTPDTALTVNAADFNGDGYTDLAVGTSKGVQIYINSGEMAYFLPGAFYPQTWGTTDIEVTNQGSDFNNDNVYDLCVSTPSVGLQYSEITVYLGNGDGTFERVVVDTVRGYVHGNCAADFNLDNQLDIACVNSGERKFVIYFGNGDGTFTNQIRFDVDDDYAGQIAANDVDLDGDMDLVLAGKQSTFETGRLYLFHNQLNPTGFVASSFEATAVNNVEIQLTSSSGKVLNRVKNGMPSAALYQRNIDGNSELDDFASVQLLESGAYRIDAMPRPNLAVGDPFSLDFKVNGVNYRLAHDASMTESGYQFEIYPNGGSPVLPLPGEITKENQLTFQWEGEGEFVFQLASDIAFENLLVNETVSGNVYAGPTLTVEDTSTFYWRVTAAGAAKSASEFAAFYPVTIAVESPTDMDEDGLAQLPKVFGLSQNHPNPFNPETEIAFALPVASGVKLEIFNIAGQRVTTLVDADYPAGEHVVVWDGTDNGGVQVATGMYLYRIQAGDFVSSRKMVLIK
ncbi:MAG: FG-GAP-like repeat-containing protein [Candidatus Zixiibacteriota bacterium]